MTTKTAEPLDLPAPVAAYFAADTTGAETVAQRYHFTLKGDKIARLEIGP